MKAWFAAAKLKIYTVVGAILAGMWYYIKHLKKKNEILEHNEEVREEVEVIKVEMDAIKEEVVSHEDERIENRIKASAGKSRRDRANKL